MRLSVYRGVKPDPENVPGPEIAPPRPKRRRPLFSLYWAIPVLVIVAAAGYLQYQKANADRGVAGGGGAAMATAVVSLGDIYSTVRISGTVVAERSATIRAPRIMGSRGDFNRGGGGAHDHGAGGHPDFILNLLRVAKAGTRVNAGDVVVEFDPENQLQRLDDYQDSVVQLKNSIRKLVANLAAGQEQHEQKVRTAHADWQKALLDLKTIPIRTRIDAERMRLIAEEAELKYNRLVAEQALVEESQRASIRSSQLVLDQSAIELERARNNVKRMTMAAPIAGIVVFANVVLNGDVRQIREGDQASAGQPVLHVVDTGSMALNGTVNQVDAERMRLGMRATIRLDAYPELTIGGTLTGIGAMSRVSAFRAGYVGEIPVRLRIDGNDTRLLPDLTGNADLVLTAEGNVLRAPRPAVFAENGQSFVFVQGDDGWTRREIVTGLRNAIHVAVRAGLQPGEIVALQRPI
jgi:HlyD family secretion protein